MGRGLLKGILETAQRISIKFSKDVEHILKEHSLLILIPRKNVAGKS